MHNKIKIKPYLFFITIFLLIFIPFTLVIAGKVRVKDYIKPTISNVSISPQAAISTKAITLKYRLSEKAKVTIQIYKSNKLIKTQIKNSLKNSGYVYSNITGLKIDGAYLIKIDAIDLANNKAASKYINLTIDNTNPIPSNFGFYKDSFDPSKEVGDFTYNVNEEVNASLLISSNNQPLRLIKSLKYAKSGDLIWNGNDEKGNIVPNGQYTYTFTTTDKAGNKNIKSGVVSVYGPPVIKVEPVLTPFLVNGYNVKDIRYSLNESAAVSIKIFKDDVLVKELYNGIGNLGENFVSWDGKDNSGNIVTPGRYIIKFNALDDLNNSAAEVTSTIDITKAKLTAANPDGSNLNLTENILSGSVIRLNISGDTFKAGVTSSDFQLSNVPTGLSISSVRFVSSATVDVTLNYAGDIDSNINDFNITAKSSALNGILPITTNNLMITAVIESITASKQDSAALNLAENNLQGSVIRLNLTGDTYKSVIATSDFLLNNAPNGLRVGSVKIVSNTSVDITLDYNGDFDTNISNFNITAKANILNSNNPITTSNIQITSVIEGITLAKSDGSGLSLSENTISESVIRVNLTGDTFKSALVTGDFILNNAPVGLNIGSVTRVNNTTVDIKLSKFNGDFDTNINNFSITVKGSGVNSGGPITSSDVVINAVDELVATKTDGTSLTLSENTLTGSVIRLSLTGDTFKTSVSVSDFQLNNAPIGTSVSSISKVSNNIIDLTLAFNSTDFDTNISNFSVTTKASGLTSGIVQTTKSITITATDELTASKTDGTGLSLAENNLNVTVIRLTLSGGDNFKSGITNSDFSLNNAPSGLAINSIIRESSTVVDLFLSFDGTDFDANINNFNITAKANGLIYGKDQTTANIVINAAVESIGAAKTDGTALALSEGNLNGAVIRLNLAGDTFKNGLAESDFTLNNAPTGTIITSVNRVNSTAVDVTIGFDGTDFDDNINNFSITAKNSALTSGNPLTTANYSIAAIVESLKATRTDGTGLILAENTLTGAVIRLSLTGDTFKTGLAVTDFQLNNAPAGTTIASINRINSTSVDITLGFDGTDFDTIISNCTITAKISGLTGKYPLTTNNITINPIIESLAAMKADGNPLALIESSLNGTKIRIALTGDTFKTGVTALDFQLNNAPAGLSIATVTRVSPTVVDLTLAFDGTDFDSNITDFNINTKATATSNALVLITNNYTITAVVE